jgi:hypothetical protein
VPTRPAVPTVQPSAPQRVLCPYCGEVSTDARRCDLCRGFFDPLSRQATQNAMGPWFIRDDDSPFRPGCSIETLRDLIRRGKVTRDTIIRGPGTKQFWNFAGRTPSIANLLGLCHNCRAASKPDDYSCKACGAVFSPDPDRQHMGLAPVHFLPGEASPEIVAAASLDTPAPVPVPTMPASAIETAVVSVTTVEKVEPVPSVRTVVAVERPPRSLGPWLVGATVIIVLAMGTVFALVATNTITLPWLMGEPAQGQPAATGPAQVQNLSPEPVDPGATPPPTPATQASPAASPPASGDTGPTGAIAPAPEVAPSPSLQAILEPLLGANPFDEAAMLARIEELRKAHPNLSKDLDRWVEAAKRRGELARLKRIP